MRKEACPTRARPGFNFSAHARQQVSTDCPGHIRDHGAATVPGGDGDDRPCYFSSCPSRNSFPSKVNPSLSPALTNSAVSCFVLNTIRAPTFGCTVPDAFCVERSLSSFMTLPSGSLL